MPNLYVGLDGEMTAADPHRGGRLIQIGIATGTGPEERITELIGWDAGDFTADPKAMAVHGIPEEVILAAPRAPEVDAKLRDWLLARGAIDGRRSVVAVGFNVGAFDLPFVRDTLPLTAALLSRRSLDLNAVCFTLGESLAHGGSRPKWNTWKRLSKEAAERDLTAAGIATAWHDAGYDALAALVSWRWLCARIGEGRAKSPSP
jgi:DNA polymerase III epsilon subunit-like protein